MYYFYRLREVEGIPEDSTKFIKDNIDEYWTVFKIRNCPQSQLPAKLKDMAAGQWYNNCDTALIFGEGSKNEIVFESNKDGVDWEEGEDAFIKHVDTKRAAYVPPWIIDGVHAYLRLTKPYAGGKYLFISED